jgi:hypothetical protein
MFFSYWKYVQDGFDMHKEYEWITNKEFDEKR